MKKICLLLAILILVLTVSGCSKKDNKKEDYIEVTDASGNIIETIPKNSNALQSVTTDKNENIKTDKAEKQEKSTENIKTANNNGTVVNTKKSYLKELRINFLNIPDMYKKVSKYKTFDALLKSGNIENNNSVEKPFKLENFLMFFDDHKFYVPVLPNGYTMKSCYLTAKGYFCFSFINSEKKTEQLKIYTSAENEEQKTNKFILKFVSEQGTDVFKNANGKYCFYINDKYIVEYSGTSKDFINNLIFRTEEIYM